MKTRAPEQKERKTRKSTAPTLIKKIVVCTSNRASRIENSSARLYISQGEQRGDTSATKDSNRKSKAPRVNNSVFETPMDIDEALNTPSAPSDRMALTSKDNALTTPVLNDSAILTPRAAAVFARPGGGMTSNKDKKQEIKQAQGSKEKPAAVLSNPPACLSPLQDGVNNLQTQTTTLPHVSISTSGVDNQAVVPLSTVESASSVSTSTCTTATTVPALPSSVSSSASLLTTPCSLTNAPNFAALTAPLASSSPASTSSCTPIVAALPPPNDINTTQSKDAADPNIVSLKIIISDNQDEHSHHDTALNQAISSISGEKIPTIYLSSPAKSPVGRCTPKHAMDEAALAVSGLQNSEGHPSPLGIKAGAVVASPLTGTSQAQQNYIIQLPLDATNQALPGTTASYFLVTESPAKDAQNTSQGRSPGKRKQVFNSFCCLGFVAFRPAKVWSTYRVHIF